MIFSKEWNDEAQWTNQRDAQRVASLVGGLVVYVEQSKCYQVLLSWGSYVKKNLVLALVLNPIEYKQDPWAEVPMLSALPSNKVG